MRKSLLMLCTLALVAGCSKGGASDAGNADAGPPPPDAPTIATDRLQLNFDGDFGQAILLGTKPADTLQIFSKGKQDLVISSVQIISGPGPDGGTLGDTALFDDGTGADKTDIPLGQSAAVQVVFDSTQRGTGFFGAILEIKSNAANTPVLDIPMLVDVVTPEVTVVGGATDLSIPVTIYPVRDDGGRVNYPDGGVRWQQIFSTGTVFLENTGTAQLQFGTAAIPADAGLGSPFLLCSNDVFASTPDKCQAGPLPNTLDRLFPDGGVFGVGLADGGFLPALAQVTVVFEPSQPGTFEQHLVVDSNATNKPEIVFAVHGTAVAGDAGL
jgi:hypothetical protein